MPWFSHLQWRLKSLWLWFSPLPAALPPQWHVLINPVSWPLATALKNSNSQELNCLIHICEVQIDHIGFHCLWKHCQGYFWALVYGSEVMKKILQLYLPDKEFTSNCLFHLSSFVVVVVICLPIMEAAKGIEYQMSEAFSPKLKTPVLLESWWCLWAIYKDVKSIYF